MSQTFNLGGLGDNKLTKLIFSNGTANTCSVFLDNDGYLVFEQGASTVTFPLGDLPADTRLAIENGRVVKGKVITYEISGGSEDTSTSIETDSASTPEVTEFYPTGMNAADNLSNYPGFTNTMYFNGSDDYLSRTPTATGNQKTWTFSAWVKLLKTNESLYLLTNSGSDGNNGISALYFKNDKVFTYYDTTGASPYGAVGPAQFRDMSAWYHVTWVVDATNSNHKVWINNRLISTDTSKYPPDYNYDMSKFGQSMVIGAEAWGITNYFNGYMANIQFIDGQALDASNFGQYMVDSNGNTTSAWVPKLYDGDYGQNGFLLDFSSLELDNNGEIIQVNDTAPKTDGQSPNNWTAN